MSVPLPLLPFLMENDRYRRNWPNNYAINIPEFHFEPMDYFRNCRQQMMNGVRDTSAKFRNDKNKFQVNLDVKHFTVEELAVKVVDGFILVRAKHGEKKDPQGWVSRQFTRKYQLPEGCHPDKVQCRLSSDGLLTVTVPLERNKKTYERAVPIIQTGPAKNFPGVKVDVGGEEEQRESPDEDASEKTPLEASEKTVENAE